jgi:hypothetical protein
MNARRAAEPAESLRNPPLVRSQRDPRSLIVLTELLGLRARRDQLRHPGASRNRPRPQLDVGAPPEALGAPIADRRREDDTFGQLVGVLGRDVEDLGNLGEINQLLHGASYPVEARSNTRWNNRVVIGNVRPQQSGAEPR